MPSSPANSQAACDNQSSPSPEEQCSYPECKEARKPDTDLCAKYHAAWWSPNGGGPKPGLVENDGIVDWEAIEIAAGGERAVKLTWVERDIAIMKILAAGHSYFEAALRVGMPVASEHDPSLRGAKFRRLAALGRRVYGRTGGCDAA